MDPQLSTAEEAVQKGDFIIGPPSEVTEQIKPVRDLGFDKLQLMFLTTPTGLVSNCSVTKSSRSLSDRRIRLCSVSKCLWSRVAI